MVRLRAIDSFSHFGDHGAMHRSLLWLRLYRFLGAVVCFIALAKVRADLGPSPGNPFKGDYYGTSHFKSDEKPAARLSEGLLVISITNQGKFSASYVNKSSDINFHVRGTVDREGAFTGTVYYQGKEWGTHTGRFNKLANGDIEALFEERPNGREIPWGRSYMRAHPMADDEKK